jgi:hypothetical protein
LGIDLRRLDPRLRSAARRRDRLHKLGGFYPTQVSAVSAWLRLAASTAVSSEWPTVVDVLNAGSPLTQPSANRIAAVGAAANGLPTMVFDGTDVHVWPLTAANNGVSKLGFWFWFKPASLASIQVIMAVRTGTGGASARKFDLRTGTSGEVAAQVFISGADGRQGITGTGKLVVGTWSAIYMQYDDSRGGDANLRIYVAGVNETLSYSNLGVGGTLTTLPVVTGNGLIGASDNLDAPGGPVLSGGLIGPNIFAFNDNLTAAQITLLMAFEAPT